MLDIDNVECYKTLISPVEDLGLNYIWYAEYPHDKLMIEYDDKKNKTSFDDAYTTRYFVKNFGLLGNKQKISFDVETGIFRREKDFHPDHNVNTASYIGIYLKSDGKIYNFNNRYNDYTNFTARKYVHADATPGMGMQTLSPSIDYYAVGYKTHIPFDDVEFDFECLYMISADDRELIKVSLAPNKDFDGVLFDGKNGSVISLKKDTRSDYMMQLKKIEY